MAKAGGGGGAKGGTWGDPRADGRVARSRAKVMAQTYRLLSQRGLSGVSIDEVAKNSGVAKTTIYRHWPSREALLIDACAQLGAPLDAPDTGTLRSDAAALLTALGAELGRANWSAVYPSIIDAAEREADIAALQAGLHHGFMAPFVQAIERARTRGEIAPGRRSGDIVAALVGPLFFRRWFSKETIDKRFINAVLDTALPERGRGQPRARRHG